jgi:hypothetical protein
MNIPLLRGLAAVMAMAAATASLAGDRLLLGGGEWAGNAYYSYVGTVLPLGKRTDGRGFVQRYWLDRLGYEYDGAPGRIEADAWGAEAAVGYVTSSAAGWLETSVGLRYTDTDLSPDDPGAGARGRQTGAKLQIQGERSIGGAWRAGAIASWANQQNNYWGRVRLTRSAGERSAVGGEVIAWGNDEGDATSAGLVMTLRTPADRWSVGLRGGYRWQDEEDSGYAGVELGYGF